MLSYDDLCDDFIILGISLLAIQHAAWPWLQAPGQNKVFPQNVYSLNDIVYSLIVNRFLSISKE